MPNPFPARELLILTRLCAPNSPESWNLPFVDVLCGYKHQRPHVKAFPPFSFYIKHVSASPQAPRQLKSQLRYEKCLSYTFPWFSVAHVLQYVQ